MTALIGIFGLGSMGYGMAQSLLRAGHRTWGFDVVAERCESLISEGGEQGAIAEVAASLDAVVLAVLNAAQTESVLFGDDGVVQHMQRGSVVVACATVPPDFARDMAQRCTEAGVHYLDAPISGGSVKAAEGALSIMASGTADAFAKAKPVLDATAATVFNLGDKAGSGSAMKSVNQMLAGVHIAMMAEAMTFAMTQDINPEQFLDVISQCAGTSWMLENRAPHIIDGDYSPRSSVDIWPKDLGIVLEIAKTADFNTPITAVALQQFVAASSAGLGGEDDAAVAKVYAERANLTLPPGTSEKRT